MNELNVNTPIGEWVTRRPETSRIFEEHRMDYCCGGKTPLDEACRERHIDPAVVLEQLHTVLAVPNSGGASPWSGASLSDLCDHIEQLHHGYLHAELPSLAQLIEKVVSVHGTRHPTLQRIEEAFSGLRSELEPHLLKEEQILFPAIRKLENSSTRPSFPFVTLSHPINMMEHEHDLAANFLSHLRDLTENFRVPEDACNSYREMLGRLQQLEADTHIHIHKENHILFPRAQRLEADPKQDIDIQV